MIEVDIKQSQTFYPNYSNNDVFHFDNRNTMDVNVTSDTFQCCYAR